MMVGLNLKKNLIMLVFFRLCKYSNIRWFGTQSLHVYLITTILGLFSLMFRNNRVVLKFSTDMNMIIRSQLLLPRH